MPTSTTRITNGAFGAYSRSGFVHGFAVGRDHTGPGDTCSVLGEVELIENGSALAPGPVSEVLPLVAEDVEGVEADGLARGAVAGPAVERVVSNSKSARPSVVVTISSPSRTTSPSPLRPSSSGSFGAQSCPPRDHSRTRPLVTSAQNRQPSFSRLSECVVKVVARLSSPRFRLVGHAIR
jgi:hypothetical protein